MWRLRSPARCGRRARPDRLHPEILDGLTGVPLLLLRLRHWSKAGPKVDALRPAVLWTNSEEDVPGRCPGSHQESLGERQAVPPTSFRRGHDQTRQLDLLAGFVHPELAVADELRVVDGHEGRAAWFGGPSGNDLGWDRVTFMGAPGEGLGRCGSPRGNLAGMSHVEGGELQSKLSAQ